MRILTNNKKKYSTLARKEKKQYKRLKKDLRLQPIQLKDNPFLQSVYATTRQDVHNNLWSAAQKHDFISQQFHLQHAHYHTYFQGANFDLILLRTIAIGRFYVFRNLAEIRIIDITLLPEYRNQQIGTYLLKNILEEGKKKRKVVTLHVEKANPALRLYERLGFKIKQDVGIRYLLECK